MHNYQQTKVQKYAVIKVSIYQNVSMLITTVKLLVLKSGFIVTLPHQPV